MMTISAHDDHINHDEHLDHEDHLDYDEHLDHDDHHNWRLYTCKCQQNDKKSDGSQDPQYNVTKYLK